VSEKSLRNGANHGFLVPAKAVWRTTGLWPWNQCEEDPQRMQWAILVRSRESNIEIPDYLSGIDLRSFPGLLSDTFMSGATAKLPVPVPAPTSRRLAIGRMIATALLLAGCCGNLYAGQAKPKMHDNRHEIEQLEEAWRNAVLKSDTTAMSALLSDDYIAITASGTLQTKDEALANLGRRHVITLDISDRKVRFYGKTALVTSLANVETTTAEGDTSGSFRYTRVYVRNRQGKWKIVSFEASRIRQPGERRKHDSVTNTK